MRLVLSSALITATLALHAQVPDLVPTNGIKTQLHQQNIGKIYFSATPLSGKALRAKDFPASCTLTNKSNLFFVAFLGNSLTNYLHQMAPQATADALVKNGNYQFTLLVDGKPIYSSNLLPGAPAAQIQNTATIISRPFIDNDNGYGSWSESFWNRFMLNGGDSALTEGRHTLGMEIRPYLNTNGTQTGPLIAAGSINLHVHRKVSVDFTRLKLNTLSPYDGFSVSTAPIDRLPLLALKARIDAGVFKRVSSIVVIKNGQLLVEEYFNGHSRSTLQDTRSVGKSFASTLTGMAIADGYLRGEQQTLKAFYRLDSFDHYQPQKDSTTIKELLTMSSGFAGDDEDDRSPGNEENMYPTADWVKFALNLPYLPGKAGTWHYFTAGVVLLGDILNKTVKGGLEAYAAEKLFKPMHISNYRWQYTPQKVPNTAGGIQMCALDFAKYGQLYKNGGSWMGQQLIPQAWVAKSFTKEKQISGRNEEYYGYLFWNKRFTAKGQAYEAFYCAGNGGNYILVFKDQPLVIVITATAYGQSYAHAQVATMLSDFILPAVVD